MDTKTLEYLFFALLLLGPLVLFIKRERERETVPAAPTAFDKCESPIERRLYNVLVNNDYYVQTQVQCGKYRIDLALPAERIAIECDGKAYHSSPSQKAHDRKKNAYLKQQGWKVLRFTGKRIYKDPKGILKRIEKELI